MQLIRKLERLGGIGPPTQLWQSCVLPLNYSRIIVSITLWSLYRYLCSLRQMCRSDYGSLDKVTLDYLDYCFLHYHLYGLFAATMVFRCVPQDYYIQHIYIRVDVLNIYSVFVYLLTYLP